MSSLDNKQFLNELKLLETVDKIQPNSDNQQMQIYRNLQNNEFIAAEELDKFFEASQIDSEQSSKQQQQKETMTVSKALSPSPVFSNNELEQQPLLQKSFQNKELNEKQSIDFCDSNSISSSSSFSSDLSVEYGPYPIDPVTGHNTSISDCNFNILQSENIRRNLQSLSYYFSQSKSSLVIDCEKPNSDTNNANVEKMEQDIVLEKSVSSTSDCLNVTLNDDMTLLNEVSEECERNKAGNNDETINNTKTADLQKDLDSYFNEDDDVFFELENDKKIPIVVPGSTPVIKSTPSSVVAEKTKTLTCVPSPKKPLHRIENLMNNHQNVNVDQYFNDEDDIFFQTQKLLDKNSQKNITETPQIDLNKYFSNFERPKNDENDLLYARISNMMRNTNLVTYIQNFIENHSKIQDVITFLDSLINYNDVPLTLQSINLQDNDDKLQEVVDKTDKDIFNKLKTSIFPKVNNITSNNQENLKKIILDAQNLIEFNVDEDSNDIWDTVDENQLITTYLESEKIVDIHSKLQNVQFEENESINLIKNFILRQNQQLQINEKHNKQEKIYNNQKSFGYLFYKKSSSNRIPIGKYIQDNRKALETIKYSYFDVSWWQKISQLTLKNAQYFKFDFNSYKSIIFPMSNCIITNDQALIIPNDKYEIGFEEIKNAFYAMPGIQMHLVSDKWIEHHFKMILIKLSWLEKNYLNLFPMYKYCNPKCLIEQLRYRYDREIIKNEKSCLKRILNGELNTNSLLALIVIDINYNSNGNAEIILSDKWYCIRAVVDLPMKKLLNDKKIKIGTKLIIQNSKLVNFDNETVNCDLFTLSNIQLRIYTNSVRRGKFDIKLGFVPKSKPIHIHLNAVEKFGGNIASLKLIIIKVYPMIKRSEKRYADLRSCNSHEIENKRFKYSAQKDETNERKFSEFSEKNSIKPEILDNLEQKSMKILKFRVIDYNDLKTNAILSIPNSNDHQQTELKPGTIIRVTNLIPTNIQDEILKISFQKISNYKIIKNNPDNLPQEIKNMLKPDVISIKDLFSSNFVDTIFNEINVYGLIVRIDFDQILNRYKSMYISDSNKNIICVNNLDSYQKVTCDNCFTIIKLCSFIYIKNLQFKRNVNCRNSTKSSSTIATKMIVNVNATELTDFIDQSKSSELPKDIWRKYEEEFNDVDLIEFQEECVKKINELTINRLQSYTSTPARNKSLSTKDRIKYLENYNNPRDGSFMHLQSSARKILKRPFNVSINEQDEDSIQKQHLNIDESIQK